MLWKLKTARESCDQNMSLVTSALNEINKFGVLFV